MCEKCEKTLWFVVGCSDFFWGEWIVWVNWWLTWLLYAV